LISRTDLAAYAVEEKRAQLGKVSVQGHIHWTARDGFIRRDHAAVDQHGSTGWTE
jgi:hypothetical protein